MKEKKEEANRMRREELITLSKEEVIEILLAVIEKQGERIAELEARLNQNSKNSSKPPSSDVYQKPKSQRKPSGKKAGGQQGHEGNGLRITQEPDRRELHEPGQCAQCAHAGACPGVRHINETRKEIDIEIKPVITAHQTVWVRCPKTNEVIVGEFPAGLNSSIQYGVNLEALAVTLNAVGMVSMNRTHEILNGVFGVPISTGTIASMVKNCAQMVWGTVSDIKDAIIEEPVVNKVDAYIVNQYSNIYSGKQKARQGGD
jgi:transposase